MSDDLLLVNKHLCKIILAANDSTTNVHITFSISPKSISEFINTAMECNYRYFYIQTLPNKKVATEQYSAEPFLSIPYRRLVSILSAASTPFSTSKI